MHVAELKLPDHITGEELTVSHQIIDTHVGAPLGADCWIGCGVAMPHSDEFWKGKLFITLTVDVKGDYILADINLLKQYEKQRISTNERCGEIPGGGILRRGIVSIVNPMTHHWLIERTAEPGPYWLALQWEMKPLDAKKKLRELVKEFSGVWLPSLDKRYLGWRAPE